MQEKSQAGSSPPWCLSPTSNPSSGSHVGDHSRATAPREGESPKQVADEGPH